MDEIHDRVRSSIRISSDRMKYQYDVKVEKRGYQLGDLVWLYDPKRRRELSPNLQRNWEGSYELTKIINNVVYRIRKSSKGKPTVNFNRVAPFAGANEDGSDKRVRRIQDEEDVFNRVIASCIEGLKIRHGVTRAVQRDLFPVPKHYA